MLQKFLEMTGAPAPKGIVHVGAHLGQEVREYKEYKPHALVWIEADPRLFARLQEHLSEWSLTGTTQWCLNTLISDEDEAFHDFHIAQNDGQASSMFRSTEILHDRYPLGSPTGEILNLETRTLGKVLTNLTLRPEQIDYLVLDTQGAELKCLRGLGDFISDLRFITAEASTVELYSGGAQLIELDAFLEPKGFLRVKSDPPAEHGNVLYVRENKPLIQENSADPARDQAMRNDANEIIANLNNGNGVRESDLMAFYDVHGPVLAKPDSRLACLIMARIAFDDGYTEALLAYLELLGWQPDGTAI